ncbi:hypothetical protein [Actinosynnema sp. NPDC020468]|uniref:hypothetical protein n=1 Tax=Actinosynnema sp. NPDC020468 TaxID=3154488 RepID=UPI0033EB0921
MVRRSVALDAFAPACRKHMTAAERVEDDTNPLWSDEGQIRWLLARQSDGSELQTAAAIAEQLKLQPGIVSRALDRLRVKGQVKAWTHDRRESWADPVLFERWLTRAQREEARETAERKATGERIDRRNRELDSIAGRLRKACAGRDVGVALVDGPAELPDVPACHALVLSVEDPAAAEWLLDRLGG